MEFTLVPEYNFLAYEPVHNMSEALLTTFYSLDSLKTCNSGLTVSTQILADHLKAQNCRKVCVASKCSPAPSPRGLFQLKDFKWL
jgi:hypothetical protein